ncbi:ornithine carbamoyltransferase precursor-like protein [Whalleya microplaca]|nr:ornithine carbamoyltransferase precursor-like protein [Whalleya microplaca]
MISSMRLPAVRLAKRTFCGTQARGYAARAYVSKESPRHLMSIADLTPRELTKLVLNAADLKKTVKRAMSKYGMPKELGTPLAGQTVAMLFNKLSTRTRVSTEAAVAILGGHPMFLGKNDIQLGVNESLRDTSQVISSMTSCIVARVGDHSEIEGLAEHSSVPVINALSNDFHPLQIIADFLTIHEAFPKSEPGRIAPKSLKIAWVGDANNVLFDFAIACMRLGVELSVATPAGYRIPAQMLGFIKSQASPFEPGKLTETTKPTEAVENADIIVTDTWISMGQEQETKKRLDDFRGFQVTEELARTGAAKENWKFMHCLPRHSEEVDDAVFYSPRSLVFAEAENRLWAALAVLQAFVVNKGEIEQSRI